MSLPMLAALLLAGFVVLIFAGDILVRGAATLAQRSGVPPLVIGLTIVAFGTSAPEIFVSIEAMMSDAPGLALGNVVGSDIANILLVLALPAVLIAIPTDIPGARTDAIIMTLATVVLAAVALAGELTFVHGAGLFAGVIAYIVIQLLRARRIHDVPGPAARADVAAAPEAPLGWAKTWLFIIVGLAGLPFGGYLIVRGGVGLAEAMGVPDAFIGLTIVAVGTSLPEMATSLMAALRRNSEVAIGNVLGSNVFNVFAVGGAAALTGRVPVAPEFYAWSFPAMLVSAAALLIVVLLGRPIGRVTGVMFFAGYVVYLAGLARVEGLI